LRLEAAGRLLLMRGTDLLAGALLLLLLLLLGSRCSPLRDYEAALVLADLDAGLGQSRLKATTPAPQRNQVLFPVAGRAYAGDLYRPLQGAQAAILLIPGAAEEGKDDPRLVAFATTLARARFNVLVPDLASLREQRVSSANIAEVADAFAWLAAQPDMAPGGRAGMVAFSYASGPVLLAALEPQIREQVSFVLAVGGYYDLEQVLIFFTTGWFRHGGDWHYLEPNDYGKWLFVLSNLHRITDPDDRRRLQRMAMRRLDDPAAPLADLAQGLSEEGHGVYAFISNRDRELAPRLLAELPSALTADIAALDLADKDLSQLRARLLLIHGYDDDIIPYTESIALARAVGNRQACLFLVHGLVHVDLEPDLRSRFRLWRSVAALLAERDRTVEQ
jgi:hypothetical protein